MELPLDFIPNPRFARKGADKAILGPMPESDTPTKKARRPSGLPPYLASLYEMPLLTREQEAHLFRKYNYLKYKAAKLRKRARSGPAEVELDGRDRAAAAADRGDEERNRPGQLAAGGFDRQAARDAGPEFLRARERRQHVAAAGDREVRLRSRQQVQHVRQLGDHEELRPDDSGRVQASRSLPHEPGRAVRRDAGAPRQPAGRKKARRTSAKRRSSGFCVGWTSASRRSSRADSAWIMPTSRRL